MKVRVISILGALFVFGAAIPALAHHAFNIEFDGNDCSKIRGTLTGIKWENPHAYIDVAIKNTAGKEETWHLEMVTPNALKRNGTLRQDFEANMGKPINVRMCRSRNKNETRGAASFLQLTDGEIRVVGQMRGDPEDRFF